MLKWKTKKIMEMKGKMTVRRKLNRTRGKNAYRIHGNYITKFEKKKNTEKMFVNVATGERRRKDRTGKRRNNTKN